MPLLDRFVLEALDGVCEDCPEKEKALAQLAGRIGLKREDGQIVDDLEKEHPNVRLGMEVSSATLLIAAHMLKDELGCDGAYDCDECDQLHCGAQRDVSLSFNFGARTE